MFNRLTDHVLKEVDPAWFLKVMDDLVIFGQTKDECFMRFERILKLLEKHWICGNVPQEATGRRLYEMVQMHTESH